MATATTTKTTEREASGLYFTETELTLALPGSSREEIDAGKSCGKRVFSSGSDRSDGTTRPDSGDGKSPAAKAQVVGWPPVRSFRKNTMRGEARYVKVAVDGAPYLRKVDLKTYGSYQELLGALESMFTCITIRNYQSENKLVDGANGMEYVLTYEDKDGDWMLAGDVPWKMFVECCKRIRLMKSAEVLDLGPRTTQIKEQ